jgi:hypothetical protein
MIPTGEVNLANMNVARQMNLAQGVKYDNAVS